MKKVLYGVAVALFACVSMGSLQSCKDDLSDLRHETKFDISNLQKQLDDKAKDLQDQITANKDNIDKLLPLLDDYASVTYVNDKIKELQDADEQNKKDLIDMINGALKRLDDVEPIVTENANAIKELQGQVEAQQKSLDALIEQVKNDNAELTSKLEELKTSVDELWYEISQDNPNGIWATVNMINNRVNDVENQLNNLLNRVDKLITNILLQGTYNPVFGDFSLPIGVRSNVLFDWYGYSDQLEDFEFPSSKKEYSATGDPGLDLSVLNPQTVTIPAGDYYADNVSLGKVYVTLNPVGHIFNDTELSIETSAGTALPYTVKLNPSDATLYHGYTRDSEIEGNGFYEGEVLMPSTKEAIDATRIVVDDNLKASMKAALKDPSKRTAASLLKALYDQMSGKIPAYGLRYNWEVTDYDIEGNASTKPYSILSNYDLAVATARPLSYNFLAGYTGSAKLPVLGHLDNFLLELRDKGTLRFDFSNKTINIDNINIQLGEIEFKQIDSNSIKIHIAPIKVNGIEGQDDVYTAAIDVPLVGEDGKPINSLTGMDKLIEDIEGAIVDGLKQAVGDINTQLNEKVIAQIKNSVSEVLASIGNDINGKIDSILGDYGDKAQPYFDKVNKAFNLYNKIANKVNNFLIDPNAYLQVTALYTSSNYVGFVSGKASDPTPFKMAGGDSFNLYLSSYTGEFVAPAYKKYVAITKVLKDNKPVNADLKALNTGDLNKVFTGKRIVVNVPASKLEAGNVYEFTYQAVDYRGYTSTKKFYIKVNK